MKPAAFHSVAGLKKISEILLVFALALTPTAVLAQRGAAGGRAAGGARGGAVAVPRAPAVRVPPPVSRPTTASPIITRPAASPFISRPIIGRPVGGVPITGLRTPVSPFRTPLTGSGILFSSRPPRRPFIGPVGPFLGTNRLFGLAYNPFFFGGCNSFWGLANGCGFLAPYYGYGGGYFPPAYSSSPGYPSAAPDYPSGPVYTPPDSSATLQYTPPMGQYPLASLPPEDLSASTDLSTRVLKEVLLYFKDGSVFSVASYTVSDGRLHYVTGYGHKNDVSVDQLDLQKTIQANAARGVAFTLTPASPGAGSSSPSPLGPAPAPPGPITPPKQ